ncbi:MAG: CpsD/CapB family tyrosine-protein kinase [Bacilli bacterium]|jgi:receptor protein-tyrosine kinase|nr:CpsD/CapB family tyrosine-protein kinase [Bacilli bacterium]MDD3348905.1 CpsD/CapB family tyrosine-protein kinase [Bacilli bacterium]MDY0209268.1 CpsD/CapB family tyrosine-protein kinase [Bacilli bacterium]
MSLFNNKIEFLDRHDAIIFGVEGNESLKESYVRLKDNILYYGIDGKKKVIQIESSVGDEAKTTTLGNIAIALGLSGKKVCVIDLDFRKARLHRLFHVENSKGITDYMVGRISKEELYKKTSYENVTLINRGSEIQNTSIILTSDKMKNFFQELRKEFDFVLIDCPPVLLISDYIHISQLSDGVLFLIAYGKTKKKQVAEAVNQLRLNNVDIMGAVFTFYDPKKSNSYYEYSSYKYYGYKYKDE